MADTVEHPPHYTAHPSGVECITITRHMNFNIGNAVKYLWRADLKHADGGLEDLEKAAWYIRDEIARRKAEAPKAAVVVQRPKDEVRRMAAEAAAKQANLEGALRRGELSLGSAHGRQLCDHSRDLLTYCPDCAAIHARNLTATPD